MPWMLSIGKLGIGQERYYLDKVAEGAEEYYLKHLSRKIRTLLSKKVSS
jgi:hypothetical protein